MVCVSGDLCLKHDARKGRALILSSPPIPCAAARNFKVLDIILRRRGIQRLFALCNNDDMVPMMLAASKGMAKAIRSLHAAGAPVLCKDRSGASPMHLAALSGSAECVETLFALHHPLQCVDVGWD